MKLVTSNRKKLREFQRFGLEIDIQEGLDLKEVNGTPEEVVIYKAIEAGEGLMVEDTILIIDGIEIVDIRDRINELPLFLNKKATWKVSIACLIGDEVLYSTSEIKGVIGNPTHDLTNSFGFDPFLYVFCPPFKKYLSLSALEDLNLKDEYSARKNCINDFIEKKNSFKSISLAAIPKWTGSYQNIKH